MFALGHYFRLGYGNLCLIETDCGAAPVSVTGEIISACLLCSLESGESAVVIFMTTMIH